MLAAQPFAYSDLILNNAHKVVLNKLRHTKAGTYCVNVLPQASALLTKNQN